MIQYFGNSFLIITVILQFLLVITKLSVKQFFFENYQMMKRVYILSLFFMSLSFLSLVYAFTDHQYHIDAVLQNSDNSMSFIELVVATWAGRSGVLLLWATLATAFTSYVIYKFENELDNPVVDKSISISMTMNLLITLFNFAGGATPFQTTNPLSDGFGISPSLDSFWQQIHPPLAFIAYSAFIFPYALGISALIGFAKNESMTNLSRRISRNFMIIGWGCVNLLIIAGSIWAYEANWNGFWAWDPIEVASLIMWLLVTANFHVSAFSNENDPIRLLGLTSGWVGVSFASFVVRSGLWEGFHGYIGIEKAIIFGSIFLLSLFFVLYAISKSRAKIFPDVLFQFKEKLPHVLTFWTLISLIFVNLVGLLIQLINNIGFRDETIPYEYYMTFNGLFFFSLVVLLLMCDFNNIILELKSRILLLVIGILLLGTLFFTILPKFLFVFILATLIGSALFMQGTAILQTLRLGNNRSRLRVQLVHFSIILLLLPYFVVDFSTTKINVEVPVDQEIMIDEFNIQIQVTRLVDNLESPYPYYSIDVIDDDGIRYDLTIHQGEYKGSYWNRGAWISQPLRDIYFILLDSNSGLIFDSTSSVELQISEKPYAILYRISLFFQFFMVVALIYGMLKHKN